MLNISENFGTGDERLGAWIEGCGVTMTGGHEPRACSILIHNITPMAAQKTSNSVNDVLAVCY